MRKDYTWSHYLFTIMYNLELFCIDGRHLPSIISDSALPEVLHVIFYYSKLDIWFNNA